MPPLIFAAFLLFATFGLRPANADLEAGWEAGLNNDFNEAADRLENAVADAPGDFEAQLSFAAALLSRQPLAQDNILRALAICERLERNSSDPDYRMRTRFLAARINHAHLKPPRLEDAAELYRMILESFPGDPIAEQAGAKLALILVDQQPSSDPRALLTELDAIADRLTTPPAIRELHLFQAEIHSNRLNDPKTGLLHLIAAREVGFVSPNRNADLDLAIAGQARDLGESEIAIRHYRGALKSRPNDFRSGTVRRLIRELENDPGS